MMPSCWTRRLKRRMALSIDSPSKTRISAKSMPPCVLQSSLEYELEYEFVVRLLAQASDPANAQIIFAFQLNQFIACCNVAAVQAPIRDVPCFVLAVMQSNCESLFLQGSHRFITFPTRHNFWVHSNSVILFERNDWSELHKKKAFPAPMRHPELVLTTSGH
jgi:hypothetical protein